MIEPDKLRELAEAGWSFSKIARETNNNVAYISRRAKDLGIFSKHEQTQKKELPLAEVVQLYGSGMSMAVLSTQFGVAIPTLRRHLIKAGVHVRNHEEAVRPSILNDVDLLRAELENKSCRRLASELKVKVKTVTDAVKKFNLRTKQIILPDIDRDVLHDLYEVSGCTPQAIANTLGLKYGFVLRQLRKNGFSIAKACGRPKPSKHVEMNDRDWLFRQYITLSRSLGDIAISVGMTPGMVSYHLKRHGIPVRSKDEYLRALQTQHGSKRRVSGLVVDSQLEEKFVLSLPEEQRSIIERDLHFESNGSDCFIDFKIGGDYVEVKSRQESEEPGPNRSRLIKQWLICRHNNIPLRVWNGKFCDIELTDIDRYYAANWKLLFDSANECFDFLMRYGFQGVEYKHSDMTDGLRNVVVVKEGNEFNAAYQNDDALKLIRHFSQHYWFSTRSGYHPVSDAWVIGNTTILRDALKVLWSKTREVNIYGLVKSITKGYKDFLQPSVFKPWVAHNIYKRHLIDNMVVFDPCMGWGGRLLGCVDLDVHYVGWDINPKCVLSHQRLAKYCRCRLANEPEFAVGDSATDDLPNADLVLCCPPYDDMEVYDGSESSSLAQIVRNIFRHKYKTVVLVVPFSRQIEVTSLAELSGYKLVEVLEMRSQALIRRESYSEPILVFKPGL